MEVPIPTIARQLMLHHSTVRRVLAQAGVPAAQNTARFTLASDMLHDLAAQDSSVSLGRRLRRYTSPSVLGIDAVGYLSYDARYADLFFEVIWGTHLRNSNSSAHCYCAVSYIRPMGSRVMSHECSTNF
jgi:hypothetical protein